MRVVLREGIAQDELVPYVDQCCGTPMIQGEGLIPAEAYPLTVMHQDDNGYVYLLLDGCLISAPTIDFDFIHEGGE